MKKIALVFVSAVLVPSLVLAWLAMRSLRDQEFVLERQQSLLFQGATDSLARQVQLAARPGRFCRHRRRPPAFAPAGKPVGSAKVSD